ncbi:MAG: hypothetical protein HRU21_13050, partial [Pseudomonadales bacterium]|nr:hypothetical protein [Pseudomonadales bacterium]
ANNDPLFTKYSFEGIDVDPVNQNIYLAYSDGPAVYNIASQTLQSLEPAGFYDNVHLLIQPYMLDRDTSSGEIFAVNEAEEVVAMTPSNSELRLLAGNIEAKSLYYDSAQQQLYVGSENGELGLISLEDDVYQTILSADEEMDIRAITADNQGYLYFLNDIDNNLYRFDTLSQQIALFSASSDNASKLKGYDNSLVFDAAQHRLITKNDYDDGLIAISLQDGTRSQLPPPKGLEDDIESALVLSQDGKHILFVSDENIYQYDLQNGEISTLFQRRQGQSLFGQIEGMTLYTDKLLLVADDDKSGLWLLNLETKQRAFVQ